MQVCQAGKDEAIPEIRDRQRRIALGKLGKNARAAAVLTNEIGVRHDADVVLIFAVTEVSLQDVAFHFESSQNVWFLYYTAFRSKCQ